MARPVAKIYRVELTPSARNAVLWNLCDYHKYYDFIDGKFKDTKYIILAKITTEVYKLFSSLIILDIGDTKNIISSTIIENYNYN